MFFYCLSAVPMVACDNSQDSLHIDAFYIRSLGCRTWTSNIK